MFRQPLEAWERIAIILIINNVVSAQGISIDNNIKYLSLFRANITQFMQAHSQVSNENKNQMMNIKILNSKVVVSIPRWGNIGDNLQQKDTRHNQRKQVGSKTMASQKIRGELSCFIGKKSRKV